MDEAILAAVGKKHVGKCESETKQDALPLSGNLLYHYLVLSTLYMVRY